LALEENPGWAVVEVSSFQLETTFLPSDTFEAAAIINLQEDHLDRHGSIEVYHGLKRRLLEMAKTRIEKVSAADVELVAKGSYFDNPVLQVNGAMAAALMRVADVDEKTIYKAFSDFAALPHRMEVVHQSAGVKYIDDSKATSLSAMAAALRMCGGSIRLIAGGLPKGDDLFSVSADLTKRVKKVYLIGRSAKEFCAAWSAVVDCEICETMERAVAASMREAQCGDTVLLSPGCASYDQFKNFGQRGEVFAKLVKKEG
jgi:UDP-N-acetylmuramoylalanine--D-glutamate ligase